MVRTFVVALACILAGLSVVASRPAAGEVLVSSVQGNAWDPLTGMNPFSLFPGETRFREISVANNPFNNPQLTGRVLLRASCCIQQLTRTPVSPGISIAIVPELCDPTPTFVTGRPPPVSIGAVSASNSPGAVIRLPPCSLSDRLSTQLAPGVEKRVFLVASASPAAVPGRYIATVQTGSTVGSSRAEMFISVTARTLPPDGPLPACGPIFFLSLASISPPPFLAKRSNPSNGIYTVGMRLAATSPFNAAGLEMLFRDLSPTGPVPLNVTTVSLTNPIGWPIGMRTIDSRNCSAPSQQVIVRAGETRMLSFSTASTTTLVFMKSTCRAAWNVGDCWGQTALGMDDMVSLTEGPFWTLFGGRRVDITKVGDWDHLPTPAQRPRPPPSP